MGEPARDWRVVALVVVSGGSGLLALAIAISVSAYVVYGLWARHLDPHDPEPLAALLLAVALAFVAALLLMSTTVAARSLRSQTNPSFVAPPIRIPAFGLLLIVWLSACGVAQFVVDADPWRWTAPVLHVLAIGVPVYLLVRLAVGGIQAGSRLRLWGTITAGLVLGTGLATAAEITVVVVAAAGGAAFLILNPPLLLEARNLAMEIGQTASMEEALKALEPLLRNPLSLVAVLLAVSVIAPIVEELAKSAATWAILDRLSTAAHGFWSGAVSGGAFALFEGLMASAEPAGGWGLVLLTRGGSSLMHIVASALAGWGIAEARQRQRAGPLLTGYGLAIGLHSIWNGSVVALAYGGARLALSDSAFDFVGMVMAALGSMVFVSLLALLPTALIVLNRRLRATKQPPAAMMPAMAPPNAGAGTLRGS